jgi:hypothetical protein
VPPSWALSRLIKGVASILLVPAREVDEETMAKKASRKRSSQKRDLVRKKKGGSAFAKRTTRGRFKEMDSVGRSQKSDRRRKAKKRVKSGFGDQGDR